jgi:hypothetical protein
MTARATDTNIGGQAAQFLDLGTGAREMGMGDAFGPIAEGPDAIYWNAAGLAQMKGQEITYTRTQMFSQVYLDFFAYAVPLSALHGTLGFSYMRLSQDSLPVVTNSNIQVGQFTPHSDAFTLAYAHSFDLEGAFSDSDRDYFGEKWDLPGTIRPLDKNREPWAGKLLVGLALEGVSEHVYDTAGSAVAVNGGVLFRPVRIPQLSLSFAFHNALGQENFISENQKLPFELDVGAAYDKRWWDSRLLPSVEVAVPYFGIPYVKMGIEYTRPMGNNMTAAVRAGINTQSMSELSALSGFTFGLGLAYEKLSFDFGFEPMSDLGEEYRFSVGWKF